MLSQKLNLQKHPNLYKLFEKINLKKIEILKLSQTTLKTFLISTATIFSILYIAGIYLFAEEVDKRKDISKYVNVTIELYGIEESIGVLKDAANSLAKSMEELENGKINSKDLERIERIATKMDSLTSKIDKTLNGAGGYLEQAKDPTVEIVSEIVKETKVNAIDPLLSSVQGTVKKSVSKIQWALILLGIVLLIALVLTGVLMVKFLQVSNSLTITLKDAFERGEFIYRIREVESKKTKGKKQAKKKI